jgi:Na+/melibiose symporter-like transporter
MGVAYIFITQYLQLGSSYSLVAIPALLGPLIAIPLWMPFIRRFERHRAWAIGLAVGACASIAVAFLPASPQAKIAFFTLYAVYGLAVGANWVGTPMMGDVADYDELRSGSNKTAVYFAFQTLISQIGPALGSGLALLVLGLFGFKMGAPMDADARLGMIVSYAWIPGLLSLIAIPMALKFPITRRRQAIIRRRLERRRAGAAEPAASDVGPELAGRYAVEGLEGA